MLKYYSEMDSVYKPTGKLLGELEPPMSEFEDAAHRVGGLNELAAQVGGVATRQLAEAALGHLSGEQAAAFQELLAAQAKIPYDVLFQRVVQTLNWLDDIGARAAAINLGDFEEAQRVHADAQRLISLIPALTERLDGVASEEIGRLQDAELEKLGHEQTSANHILARLHEAMDRVGALPLPILLDGDARRRIAGEVQAQLAQPAEDITEVDTFPVDASKLTNEQLGERVRRRYPEKRFVGASEFLALLLAEDPGRVYTYQELGQIMYPDDPTMAKGRVSTLLSACQTGRIRIIPRILGDVGLVLQRGVRVKVDAGDEQVGMERAVYRAVPADKLASDSQVGTNNERDKGWQYVARADSKDAPK